VHLHKSPMKNEIAALLLAAFAMLTSACEQHKWDETKKLFKEGEAGGEHGKAEPHGDKPAGHEAEKK
jgi:hypothetical protein